MANIAKIRDCWCMQCCRQALPLSLCCIQEAKAEPAYKNYRHVLPSGILLDTTYQKFRSFKLLYLACEPSYWKTVESELLGHLKWLIENPNIPCPPDFQCQHNEHILKANSWESISGEPSDTNSLKK
jgi:hypothetical protein